MFTFFPFHITRHWSLLSHNQWEGLPELANSILYTTYSSTKLDPNYPFYGLLRSIIRNRLHETPF
jgi:hypothetical protein